MFCNEKTNEKENESFITWLINLNEENELSLKLILFDCLHQPCMKTSVITKLKYTFKTYKIAN